jgi:O-antigen ligase
VSGANGIMTASVAATETALSHGWRRHAASISVLVAVAWWLGPVAWSTGGRDAHVVSVAAVLTAVAVVASRPHRVLSPAALMLALWLSVASFLVAALGSTGWAGATVAASYTSTTWLGVAVGAIVRSRPETNLLFAVSLSVAAAAEFARGWTAWWGGGNPAQPMIGTFYWWNPFAIFLVPGALIGLWLWLRSRRTIAGLGLLGLVLGTVGVVYSTSRASLACLVAGVVTLGVFAVVPVGRMRRSMRLVVATAVTFAVIYAIAGPPFFAHRQGPSAAINHRVQGQSLGQNGAYRLEFWREATAIFRAHPIHGGGYHSFAAEAHGRVPANWAISSLAHNGYLQALADGGLLLAVPFFLITAIVIVGSIRLLWSTWTTRSVSLRTVAIPVALGAVLLHAAVDFDWSYPADLAVAAMLGGLVVGASWRAHPCRRRHLWLLTVAAVGCLAVCVPTAWRGDLHTTLPALSERSAAIGHQASAESDR